MQNIYPKTIALIGGGPAALMMIKHLSERNDTVSAILIFEKNDRLGVGMPYGKGGSNNEHVANVSASELPNFAVSFEDYITKHPTNEHPDYFAKGSFNPNQVIPRLLLGNYLEYLFDHYIKVLRKKSMEVVFRTNCRVVDIETAADRPYKIITETEDRHPADIIVVCTGHHWPTTYEDVVKGWYDSPYPPSKFTSPFNGPVAIRGTSLTAVDAVKTLSRLNGNFETGQDDLLSYHLNPACDRFKITLFSTGGFLPALRFHSDGEAYSSSWVMSLQDIYNYKSKNGGFVDLDHVFDLNFKCPLKSKDPAFYDKIKDLDMEGFVAEMMKLRKALDSFDLFKAEYREAERSIKHQQSISWKETLAAFSYAMNYPAKHFSAEDMLRLRKTMMPLISVIIASLPQSSYKELIALYEAGLLDLVQVDQESRVVPNGNSGAVYHYTSVDNEAMEEYYPMFIDAIGQRPLNLPDLPFEGLKKAKLLSSAYLDFRDNQNAIELQEKDEAQVYKGYNDNYYLKLPGLKINDLFQALDPYGQIISNLYIMAVPFIGGLNPDYSGLDFCDTAAERIVDSLPLATMNEDIIDLKDVAS
ncbi:Uncharacterized NAD(P)/FAD-binding protein YdhS [Epilithonimonas hungarica]|uniref:Uncharacterized NAD(P)/FAD-binding protein YdhS n=2 Tax=Epilithonimonas hungarica TaxID=454006 RepID=A0A1G7JTM4_9FLAO|nr:Uncharacterized NAD(P)/FAD-binding protein YdhS [Epilithonimonas hungarica]